MSADRLSKVRRGGLGLAVAIAFALAATGCRDEESSGGAVVAGAGGASAGSTAAAGSFDLLTYNVKGLPDFLQQGTAARNTPLISPLLNAYDIVLVQEDFSYHHLLEADARHPYRSTPLANPPRFLNDGLNRFSSLPLGTVERFMWRTCFGVTGNANDCLAAKGFSFARHRLPGTSVEIDVYNHHADAGGAQGDILARQEQFAQMRDRILAASAGRAVIVAGDTNLRRGDPDDEPTLRAFEAATGLVDVDVALGLGQDRIDRVFFRSGPDATLSPVLWRVASEFVDGAGQDLSDHKAIHVRFDWTTP
jgi:hypothetical protein